MPNFKNPIRMTKNCAKGNTYWPTADKKSLPTYSRPGPSNWTKSIFRWFQDLGAVGLCCDDTTGETPRQVRCHESCHPQLCRMSKSVVLWCLVACWGYTDKMKANTHVLQMLAGRCLLFRTHSQLSWLVVSTHLKNISQLGWLFPIYGKIKHVPNHQPVSIALPFSKLLSCDCRQLHQKGSNKLISKGIHGSAATTKHQTLCEQLASLRKQKLVPHCGFQYVSM